MHPKCRVYVGGHRGLVGSAILRALQARGYKNLILKTREELDLCDQSAVKTFFSKEAPEIVILCAARVGGIGINAAHPARFIEENLLIQTNVLTNAQKSGVKRLLFLGSSCIYPKLAPQPLTEDSLLTGELEPTNTPYAIAKIAGISLCQAYNQEYGTKYLPVMPTNLYGPGDNFDPETSHVLPALISKFHFAKVFGKNEVVLWGTGTPKREFLYVDDLAEACIFLLEQTEEDGLINIGTGEDLTIGELAKLVRNIVGYKGNIVFDPTKPDGTPRKLLNVDRIHRLGWHHKIGLEEGIRLTYDWFCANAKHASQARSRSKCHLHANGPEYEPAC